MRFFVAADGSSAVLASSQRARLRALSRGDALAHWRKDYHLHLGRRNEEQLLNDVRFLDLVADLDFVDHFHAGEDMTEHGTAGRLIEERCGGRSDVELAARRIGIVEVRAIATVPAESCFNCWFFPI